MDYFDAFGVELPGLSVAGVTGQYQKDFKRQSLTGRVLPDFKEKHQWNQSRAGALVVQAFLSYKQKAGSWCLPCPFKAPGLAALIGRVVLIITVTAFAQNSRVSLSLLP